MFLVTVGVLGFTSSYLRESKSKSLFLKQDLSLYFILLLFFFIVGFKTIFFTLILVLVYSTSQNKKKERVWYFLLYAIYFPCSHLLVWFCFARSSSCFLKEKKIPTFYFNLVSYFYIYFLFLCLCYPFIPQFDFCCSLFALFYLSRLVTKVKEEGIVNCSRLLLLSTVTVRVENNTSCSEIVWYPKERGTFIRLLTWFLLCRGCNLWAIMVLITVPNSVLNYGNNSWPLKRKLACNPPYMRLQFSLH